MVSGIVLIHKAQEIRDANCMTEREYVAITNRIKKRKVREVV